MLNRNFKTVMLGWLMGSVTRGDSTPKLAGQTIYNVEGGSSTYPINTENTAQTYAIINALNTLSISNTIARSSLNRIFMAVGTGTTEATAEDYTLESENTDITCEAITQTYTTSYKRQITATFNNPTAQDITLKEAGLFYETHLNENYYINTIMLARENIDVTIPAGESKAITMEIG